MLCPEEVAILSFDYFVNEYDVSNNLKSISVPVLILVGDKDLQISNSESKFLLDNIPNAKLEIIGPKAGHMIQYEKPDLVNNIIEKFLNTLG